MHVAVHGTAIAAAEFLADRIVAAIAARPTLTIGLPAGRTPVDLYRALVERHRARRVDFRQVTVFNVDELVGVRDDRAGTYGAFMTRHLFAHVNLAAERIHLPNGNARRPAAEAQRYEAEIGRAGGLDLVVLGLGGNGHIAFNEPAATLTADTHVARLLPATRRANAASFGGHWRQVPRHGITMGMGTLLRAREVVLLATGASKAGIVARALEGPIATRVPASLLQTHPNATAVLDRAAAARLRRR
jgi:glucosamine-6-phosphate deaminase